MIQLLGGFIRMILLVILVTFNVEILFMDLVDTHMQIITLTNILTQMENLYFKLLVLLSERLVLITQLRKRDSLERV